MTLADKIEVNTRYTRSTNVERDRGSRSIIEAYLPTLRGISLLEDIAAVLGPEDQPRTWSLIGPYGSGKSSFALFLHELLGKDSVKATASRVLAAERPDVAESFAEQSEWCRVVLTGSEEPMTNCLLAALDEAASGFWSGRPGRKPSVLDEIRRARKDDEVTGSRLLELVDALQGALEKAGAGGLLIVVDELGKFLEYEARRGGGGMFILQQLAERAFRGRSVNLMLFVLLHQGFDLYARGMGEKLKNDWTKVQGRFQSVSFVETSEQTLRVVAAAFSNSLSDAQRSAICKRTHRIAKAFKEVNGLPASLDEDAAAQIFARCYPLHPISLLALPVLCQRFAQNERTLFSYLGSREPHGFKDSMESLTRVGDWVHPGDIYDYFVQNQPAVLADPLTHRRWAEVVTAVERAENVEGDCQVPTSGVSPSALAKAIGVLNLISRSDGLKASESVLAQLYPTKKTFRAAVQHLLDISVVQYRRFSDEYRVWQGTDFDIDERTNLEREKFGRFELASALSERIESAPVVARRHSVRTGALRYFNVAYVDVRSSRMLKSDGRPRIVFFLAEGKGDEETFSFLRQAATPNDIWALHHHGSTIRAAIADVLALEGVQRGGQELASDPVAAREIKERLQAARVSEKHAINSLVGDPGRSDWYWRDQRLEVADGRALQRALSDIMDRIYEKSPVIRNELANRDRLSSQAAAARNKLFQHMLDHRERPGLGIEKYPPEKAIYRSVLEAGRLHVALEAGWGFVAPVAPNPLDITPVWARLEELFEMSESGPVTFESLMGRLAEPPFGVKRGVFPILFLHYYLLHQHEIAFYDEGVYSPTLTYEHLERLVRRPDLFSFQRFRIHGVRASLFDEYGKALFAKSPDSADPLSLARELIRFLNGLSDYTRKTRRLSAGTLRVRDALLFAKSPHKLLFHALPEAVGYGRGEDLSGFAEGLRGALQELQRAQDRLVDQMRIALCNAFDLQAATPLGELREQLRGRCQGLDRYTVDTGGLRSFLRRFAEREPDNDHKWFVGILLFLGRKPAGKWTDQDRDSAEYRLADFASRQLDLEKLRLHFAAASRRRGPQELVLVKTISEATGEVDQVVALNPGKDEAISYTLQQMEELLARLNDSELELALIARLASRFLADYHSAHLSKPRKEHERQHA